MIDRRILIEMDDFQVLDVAHQVEHTVCRGLAGMAERTGIDTAVNRRPDQPDSAALQQLAGGRAHVLATEKNLVDGAVALQCLLFVEKQPVHGAGHADQHGDPLLHDQLRDLPVIVIRWSAHRPVSGLQLFQRLGKT